MLSVPQTPIVALVRSGPSALIASRPRRFGFQAIFGLPLANIRFASSSDLPAAATAFSAAFSRYMPDFRGAIRRASLRPRACRPRE
jgi:hypothetical protein